MRGSKDGKERKKEGVERRLRSREDEEERASSEREEEREREKEGRAGTGQVQTRPGPVTDEQTNRTRANTQSLVVPGEKRVCVS